MPGNVEIRSASPPACAVEGRSLGRWTAIRSGPGRSLSQFLEQTPQFRSEAAQFVSMHGGKPFKQSLAPGGNTHVDTPVVRWIGRAADQQLPCEPIHQPDGAVMAQIQSLGKFSNGYASPGRKSLDREQRLMLRRRHS